MKNLILIIVISAALAACKKDPPIHFGPDPKMDTVAAAVPDTVWPGSYYPVYPGSWWKYRQDGNTIVDYTTSPQFVKSSYLVMDARNYPYGPNGGKVIYSDTAYVPLLNGDPVYGYSRI